MKKTIFIITALLISLFTLNTATISASAAETEAMGWDGNLENSYLEDDADLFTDDEEEELTEKIRDKAQELEMNIVVFVAGSGFSYFSDSETEDFADDSYDAICGMNTDGLFYYMDFSGKQPAYDYISTSGKAVLFYQDYIDDIFQTILPYLPPSGSDYTEYTGDIKDAISVFLGQLSSYEGDKSYYYDGDSDYYFYYENDKLVITKEKPLRARLKVLIFAVPAGLIVALVYYFVMKHKYKFKSSTNPNVYVSPGDTRFTHREDRFLRTHTSRTKIESSSGGSRGGGGGGGGGHGGGGCHR